VTARPAAAWIVASEGTVRRWRQGLERLGRAAVPLPWSEVLPPDEPEALAEALSEPTDLVLLTSANAVRWLPSGARPPAACVGAATAEAARAARFEVLLVGEGGGADLAHAILADLPDARRVLFLRGGDAREEATEVLRAHGRSVRSAVAYETRPRAAFVSEVRAAPPPRGGIVVGSPRAAEALADALDISGRAEERQVLVVAVGETTAARLEALGFPRVVAAARPGAEGIAEALGSEG
jgi:uroporphyrinogen-III synthase